LLAAIHIVLGLIILALAIVLLIWTAVNVSNGRGGPRLSKVLVGLLDLQILLGIIAFAIHPRWSAWLLHPLFMIAAAGVAHVMLKGSRSRRSQLTGYVWVVLLLLLGVWADNILH
jgi:heme A synthase